MIGNTVDVAPPCRRAAQTPGAQHTAGTVILTRPAGRNKALAQALAVHGVPCLILPALELTSTSNAAPTPHGFDLVLFVSRFAAQCYFQALPNAPWPAGVWAAGVGPATLDAVRAWGRVPPHAMICPNSDSNSDSRHDSESLWHTLQAAQIFPRRVLIVRGDTGRDWLRQQWRSAGVQVHDYIAYHRQAAVWSDAQGQQLARAAAQISAQTSCVLLVSSADSARAIDKNLRRLDLAGLWAQCRILALHPRIADCVAQLQQAAGLAPHRQIAVVKPDEQAMLAALLVLAQARESGG